MNPLNNYQIKELKSYAENQNFKDAHEIGSHKLQVNEATLQVVEVFDNSDGLLRLYMEMELKPDKPCQWTIDQEGEKKWLYEVIGIEVALNPTDKNAMIHLRPFREMVLKEPGFYLGDMMCTKAFLEAPKEFVLYWLAWARMRILNKNETNPAIDAVVSQMVTREYRQFNLDRFNQILDELIVNQPKGLDQVPADIKKFIHVFAYEKKKMVISQASQNLYDELLLEWNNKEIFHKHNLKVRHKILLYGPSGNGKTTFARNLSMDIGLPFFELRQDMIIDALYGATGKNLATIFGYLKYPCILFFDEVDSFLNKRGNKNDMPEVDRALNTFLVYLEKLSEDVILIGATNRLEDMDVAGVRRFNVIHELSAPGKDQKIKLIDQLSDYYKLDNPLSKIEKDALCEKYSSYSYIEEYMIQRARQEVFVKIKKHPVPVA